MSDKPIEPMVNGMQACKALGIGATMMSAIKRQMGITSGKFFLSDVTKWLRNNPTFKLSDVYKHKPKKA